MHKPFTTLIFSLTLLSIWAPRASAQVDAIPDPDQDFYQIRQPKRSIPQSISSDAANNKDVSDQNSVDLKSFHDRAQPKIIKKASPAKDLTVGAPTNNANNDLNDAMTDVMPQPAPDFKNGQSSLINEQSILPTAPVVTHPEVMPRPPIPTPPAVTLLPPLNGGHVKEDLAWRARAFKLRSESAESKNGLVKGFRLVNANFEDTMAALTKVCSSTNMTVDSVFESAGQVLVHPSDAIPDKSRIIFSLKPVTRSSTLLRVGLDADNHNKQISFDDLLNRVETAANEKGLL